VSQVLDDLIDPRHLSLFPFLPSFSSAHKKKRPQLSPPMSIYPAKSYPITKGLSEFEILKASHKYVISTNHTHTHVYLSIKKKGFFARTQTKAKPKITRTEKRKKMEKKTKKKGG